MPNAILTPGVLLDDLVPLADDVRGLYAELGARDFRAFVVRKAWDGGEVGVGNETDVVVTEILPLPNVSAIGVHGELRPAGLEEEGDLVLSEVSLTWTEGELYSPDDLAANEQHLIRLDGATGQGVRSRYYVPAAPPVPDRTGLGWVMRLRRVEA